MSRLQDVRTIMAASLKSVAGLTCSNTVPAVINPPCAILKPVSGNWDTTLPRQAPMDKYELTVILPAASSPEEAQKNMDALLETAGTIKTAIESANYAGKINYARVTGWRNYGDAVMLGETAYLGVVFDIITY